jgi:hypothetical protein
MAESQMPIYVDRGGRQVLRPPISCKNVGVHGFMFAADLAALQRLCDRYLNQPSGGRLKYVPLVPRVIILCANTEKLQSVEPPDRDLGFMTEIDVAFWVPVAKVDPTGASKRPHNLTWFLPYVFVDNPLALATGREVYGYPKDLGTFEIPQGVDDANRIGVSTYAWKDHGPDSKLELSRLFEVRRTDPPSGGGLARVWDTLADAFQGLMRLIFGNDGKFTLASLELLVDVFEYLVSHEVPNVFIKQFRDVADPNRACYQAIVEAKEKVTGFRTAGLLAGEYELTIFPFASHPIAADLGLSSGPNEALAAWYVDFDFDLEKGRTL